MTQQKDITTLVDLGASMQERMYPTYTGEECFALLWRAAFGYFVECTGQGLEEWAALPFDQVDAWMKRTLQHTRDNIAFWKERPFKP